MTPEPRALDHTEGRQLIDRRLRRLGWTFDTFVDAYRSGELVDDDTGPNRWIGDIAILMPLAGVEL